MTKVHTWQTAYTSRWRHLCLTDPDKIEENNPMQGSFLKDGIALLNSDTSHVTMRQNRDLGDVKTLHNTR